MPSPLFTIILPTYNRCSLLPRAIGSVIAQGLIDWELIVIDDGSTDDTQEYLSKLTHKSITSYHQENKGRSAARNYALDKASGEYICFLDSDDELMPNYLSNFMKSVKNQKRKLILAGVQLVDTNTKSNIIPASNPSECIVQCLEGCFNLMPFSFHKSLLHNKKFDELLYYGEDFHFFIPLIAMNDFIASSKVTSIVHQHSERTINNVYNSIKEGYGQLQKSVIQTIDDNYDLLSQKIGEEKLKLIKEKKVQDYILTAAKYNYKEASQINKLNSSGDLGIFRLLLQRIKGLIQS